MKKDKITFYNMDEDKTEFLFESDAEKAVLNEAAKPKRPKVYKKIIRNSVVLSVLLVCAFVGFNSFQSNKLFKLNASLISSSPNDKQTEEKMNESSEELETINNNDEKYEIIINKANPITEDKLKDYEQVEVLDNAITGVKIEKETYKNYLELKENLLQRGYFINIRSGYRSFGESEEIYNSYKSAYGEDYVEKYVAKPGVSEHNTGMAFDFIITHDKTSLKTDYQSDEYKYLENIAYLYGFIIRYPKGKEAVTGYEYEPWHLRYVGTELAKYLTKNNLTLEEYYETKE